jgi:hypothetical protein
VVGTDRPLAVAVVVNPSCLNQISHVLAVLNEKNCFLILGFWRGV